MGEGVSELAFFPYRIVSDSMARLHAQLDSHKSKAGPYEYRGATSQHISPPPLTSPPPTQGPEALLLVFPYSMSMALSRAARYL